MSRTVLRRIDHVGIAVHDLDQAIDLYERRLGLKAMSRERLEAEGVEVAMIPVGDSRIELLTPLGAESNLRKFLADRGEAVHHVASTTDDVGAALRRAGTAGGAPNDHGGPPRAPGPPGGGLPPPKPPRGLNPNPGGGGRPGG